MNELTLHKDLIAQPELWRLVMLAQSRRLDVALLPPVDTEPLIYRSIMLDPEAPSMVKAVEDAVYANPLLLSDFRSVTCLVDTPTAMAVPTEVPPADYEMLIEKAFDMPDATVTVSPTGTDTAVMLMAMDADLRGFLSRTFYNIRFAHHLAPLCRYLAAGAVGNSTSVYALARHGCVDLVALDGRRLLSANTFECTAVADAAYYILASCKTLSIDPATCDIITGGEATATAELDTMLQRFAPRRSTLQLPPLKFKVPADAADIPLQLIIPQQQ